MRRGPTSATCSAPILGDGVGCGRSLSGNDLKRARVFVTCWPLSYSKRGTLTNPRVVLRNDNQVLCEGCFAKHFVLGLTGEEDRRAGVDVPGLNVQQQTLV